MNFPLLLVSSGIYPYTPPLPLLVGSSPLIFLHQLDSFNISFTASCFAQIPPSSEGAGAFEDKCDQSRGERGGVGVQNLASGHLGFLRSCSAVNGA